MSSLLHDLLMQIKAENEARNTPAYIAAKQREWEALGAAEMQKVRAAFPQFRQSVEDAPEYDQGGGKKFL